MTLHNIDVDKNLYMYIKVKLFQLSPLSFRRQLELVKEELLQSEGAREDLKIKAQQQEADILHMQQRIDELMVE